MIRSKTSGNNKESIMQSNNAESHESILDKKDLNVN